MIRRRPWTTREVETMREMRRQGYSAAETAIAIDRTADAIRSRLHDLQRIYGEPPITKLSAYDRRQREAV